MLFPTLPTDHLYKFMFVGGVFLAVFGVYLLSSDTKQFALDSNATLIKLDAITDTTWADVERVEQVNQYIDGKIKQVEEADSLFRKGAINTAELHSKVLLLKQDRDSLKKIIQKQDEKSSYIASVNQRIDKEFEMENRNINTSAAVDILTSIIGFYILATSFNGWKKIQTQQDVILYEQSLAARKSDVPCQSCGMSLKYDNNYKEGDRYCHTCYNGKQFTEPSLTIVEIGQRIKQRMTAQGAKSSTIDEQLKSLPKLDRWNKEFRWD